MAVDRISKPIQFDVDWASFVWPKVYPPDPIGPRYPAPPKSGEHTTQSGPIGCDDIFSDRRSEGRRHNGR